MPDDDRAADVLELRGVLRDDGFELLRVHERTLESVRRRHASPALPDAAARLSTEDGHEVSQGWVGVAATTFDDVGPRLLEGHSRLVRVLLPLPREDAHREGLWAEFVVGEHVVWREPVAPERPQLGVTAEVGEDVLLVRWEASVDAPADVLLRSPEGGGRVRAATAVHGGSAELPLASLPGGAATVAVRVASGLRESVAEPSTEPVELPPRPGTMHVHVEREQAPVGQPVTAVASAVDSWGMPRAADHVRWVVAGELVGTGPVVPLDLPEGNHRVWAEDEDAEPADVQLVITDDGSEEAPPTTE